MKSVSIIRPALPEEAPTLSQLAFKSKAHWGYDANFMEQCRQDLEISEDDCSSGKVFVSEEDGEIKGFYQITGDPPTGELSDLFVAPEHIGRGVGRELLQHSLARAKQLGFSALEIHSDPHAKDFYTKMGAVHIGKVASSSIPGRTLPLLKIDT